MKMTLHFPHFVFDNFADNMPRERKLNHGNWTEDNMRNANEAVMVLGMSLRSAIIAFNDPKSTLQNRVVKLRRGLDVDILPKLGRHEKTFRDKQEAELVRYLLELDNWLRPVTK